MVSANKGVVFFVLLASALISLFLFSRTDRSSASAQQKKQPLQPASPLAILPIPDKLPGNPQKAQLGKLLFFDRGLSPAHISCSHCHRLDQAGIDGQKKSLNLQGGFDEMNTPTIFNSVFNFRYGWTGSVDSLEAQLDKVLNDPRHMNSSWSYVIAYLQQQEPYRKAFARLYKNTVNRASITDAIVQFEKTLITPDAPFDRYLKGDKNALSKEQKRGYRLFNEYGCISCHQGINIGGNLFARFGIYQDPFAGQKKLQKIDLGRYNQTYQDRDRHVFRVPSLRNVARTAPYFHDGRAATLKDAIKAVGLAQLGREIPARDILSLEAFLESLTGHYEGKPL